jgi:hypothetical protein
MIRAGVDPANILIERTATNTAENVFLSHSVLESARIAVKRLMLVQKSLMSLRALLTTQHRWPGIDVGVSQEPIFFSASFERYGRTSLVDIIAGATQRVINLRATRLFRLRRDSARGAGSAEQVDRAGLYGTHADLTSPPCTRRRGRVQSYFALT